MVCIEVREDSTSDSGREISDIGVGDSGNDKSDSGSYNSDSIVYSKVSKTIVCM